ncbi:MAG TPA: response regulator [Candidatus Omnitrophota bacterium]|nr:response regulator [Candidatus Omnitrophota bacterium]HPS36400.1 response regulator [Candidatus Omnitrophota bacterium]
MEKKITENQKTILLIDDDVDFSEMAKMFLDKSGLYRVGICNDSTRAMEFVRGWRPDLVLLDVMMPHTDGGEVAALLRADSELSSTPVIFMTSLMTPGEAARSSKGAKNPFIPKPISGEDLVLRVRRFFELGN